MSITMSRVSCTQAGRAAAVIRSGGWAGGSLLALLAGLILGWPQGAPAEPLGGPDAKVAVDSSLPVYMPAAAVSGALTIAGSDSMRPLLTKLASEFRLWHPQAKIAIQGTGGNLLERFLSGIASARRGDGNTTGHLGSQVVRLLALSRELTKDELAEFVERFGYKPMAIPIAQDAVAVYVHRNNPVKGLTLDQVDAIFSNTRKRGQPQALLTWGQVGLTGEWEGEPIHLYGRDKRSAGTRPFFIEHALLNGAFRDDVQEEPGSASVVVSISRDRFGIGYSSVGFQTSAVRIVPLAMKEGMAYVDPSRESVIRGGYPLSRRLYLYLNHLPTEPIPPVILEFLKFVNSRRGQAMVAAVGDYPISTSQAARNLQVIMGVPAGPPVTASQGAAPVN